MTHYRTIQSQAITERVRKAIARLDAVSTIPVQRITGLSQAAVSDALKRLGYVYHGRGGGWRKG